MQPLQRGNPDLSRFVRLNWRDLLAGNLDASDGADAELRGFAVHSDTAATRFLLVPEPTCCVAHVPRDPHGAVAVSLTAPLLPRGPQHLRGTLRIRPEPEGWHYALTEARPVAPPGWDSVGRRAVIGAGPLLCLAGAPARADDAASARVLAAGSIDVHSHAGGIASVNRISVGYGYSPIAEPMRRGGMAAICWAIVSDGPTHKIGADNLIHPYREPSEGELYRYGSLAFDRVHRLARDEKLAIVRDRAGLAAARAGTRSVIITAEGADFLEGQLDRVDEAYTRWGLRHLQLTHYRVNALGDIQTEPPVHNGLTDFGAAVIQRCNQLGIVVDVAHAPMEMVRRAAAVTKKPLVLSHTSLTARPGPRSRQIIAAHAQLIASTGGVIGVWPPIGIYPTLAAMAQGMRQLADVVGSTHVALGTDLRGLPSGSALADYDQMPAVVEALLGTGFSEADATGILGGNYARVFNATMTG